MYLHMGSSAYLAMGGHLPMTHSCGPSCYVDMGLRLLFFFFFFANLARHSSPNHILWGSFQVWPPVPTGLLCSVACSEWVKREA